MNEYPERDMLTVEFQRERSLRRAVKVLQAKRSRIRDDLLQLATHLSMLVPMSRNVSTSEQSQSDLLVEALDRLNDDAFAQLLLQVLKEAGQ